MEFEGTVQVRGKRPYLALPFDPDEAWGARERHHVTGFIQEQRIRGPIGEQDGLAVLMLPVAWLRDGSVVPGARVRAQLEPEGPQLAGLDPDIAAALSGSVRAQALFEALPTFYRKGYLRWLDGAARRPAVREQRLREFIAYLEQGLKERPR